MEHDGLPPHVQAMPARERAASDYVHQSPDSALATARSPSSPTFVRESSWSPVCTA